MHVFMRVENGGKKVYNNVNVKFRLLTENTTKTNIYNVNYIEMIGYNVSFCSIMDEYF